MGGGGGTERQARARCHHLAFSEAAAVLVFLPAACRHNGGTPRCCCRKGVSDAVLKSKLESVDGSRGEVCQAHAPGTTLGTARCSEVDLNDKHDILQRKRNLDRASGNLETVHILQSKWPWSNRNLSWEKKLKQNNRTKQRNKEGK